jgi:hypothetical protein
MKAFTFSINQKVCMVRHGASHKIKYFKVLLYMRSKAKTRCDFGKDQGLARRKGKKERVTPEFGERKKKKFYPQIQGVTWSFVFLLLSFGLGFVILYILKYCKRNSILKEEISTRYDFVTGLR